MSKVALVTGAGGFVGGHLAERLSAEGYKVFGLDIREPRMLRLEELEFIEGDLQDPETARWAIERTKPDFVFHTAADMGGMDFIESHERSTLFNNSSIDSAVFQACADLRVK